MRTLHPAAFWRPGDFLLPGTMAIMLSMESMIAISSRRGGGGRQTFPVPLSRRHKKPPCVGADAHIGPLKRTPCKKYVIARAHRARGNPPLPIPKFLKIFSFPLLTRAQNAIIMRLISNDKPVRKKSSTAQGILRELRVVRSKRCAAV